MYGTSILKQLLSCEFGKKQKKLAVDKLTMNMHEGQITALIGHNGAGTTLDNLIFES
jgi:ABC-type multidrug transport system ATPase subunit